MTNMMSNAGSRNESNLEFAFPLYVYLVDESDKPLQTYDRFVFHLNDEEEVCIYNLNNIEGSDLQLGNNIRSINSNNDFIEIDLIKSASNKQGHLIRFLKIYRGTNRKLEKEWNKLILILDDIKDSNTPIGYEFKKYESKDDPIECSPNQDNNTNSSKRITKGTVDSILKLTKNTSNNNNTSSTTTKHSTFSTTYPSSSLMYNGYNDGLPKPIVTFNIKKSKPSQSSVIEQPKGSLLHTIRNASGKNSEQIGSETKGNILNQKTRVESGSSTSRITSNISGKLEKSSSFLVTTNARSTSIKTTTYDPVIKEQEKLDKEQREKASEARRVNIKKYLEGIGKPNEDGITTATSTNTTSYSAVDLEDDIENSQNSQDNNRSLFNINNKRPAPQQPPPITSKSFSPNLNNNSSKIAKSSHSASSLSSTSSFSSYQTNITDFYQPIKSAISGFGFGTSKLTRSSSPMFSLRKGTKTKEKGFRNLGNTCYMNSVLQSFFGINQFVNDLKNKELVKITKQEEYNFYSALMSVLEKKEKAFKELTESKWSMFDYSTSIDPRRIKDSIDRVKPVFKGHFQHDAHEFFLALLDQLEEELKELLNQENNRIMEQNNEMGNHEENGDEKTNNKKITTPATINIQETMDRLCPVDRNLKFVINKVFTCQNCKDKSETKEMFTDISLDILHYNESTYNIQDLLDIYLKEESIERKCPKCSNEKSTITKYFSQSPNVLVLHLKRFVRDSTTLLKDQTVVFPTDTINIKVNRKVEKDCKEKDNNNNNNNDNNTTTTTSTSINGNGKDHNVNNEIIDLDDNTNSKEIEKETTKEMKSEKYTIHSVIQHLGSSLDSGHYVSYLKKDDVVWKCYDDSDVTESMNTNVFEELETNGYIFFYLKDQ